MISRLTCRYLVDILLIGKIKVLTSILCFIFLCEHVSLFSCADKVNCSQGSQLYQMSREQLREVCGVSDGIRLFSQLQKDKSKVCRFTVEALHLYLWKLWAVSLPASVWNSCSVYIGVHSSRGLGGSRSLEKVPLRVEPECLLEEGTEWVVGHSTEMVDSSPSTESMDFWAATPWTESVDFSLQRMSLVYVRYLATCMAHGHTAPLPDAIFFWGGAHFSRTLARLYEYSYLGPVLIWILISLTTQIVFVTLRKKKVMKYPFPVLSPNLNSNYNTKS